MPDSVENGLFRVRIVHGRGVRMMLYMLLCIASTLGIGYASAALGIRALVYAVVFLVVFVLTAKGNSVIPVSVAVAALVLLPKSLPALQIGSFAFGWGVGDGLIFLALGLASATAMVKSRQHFLVGGYRRLDGAVAFYSVSLVTALIMGILRDLGGWALVVGSYVKVLQVLMVYITVRLTLKSSRSFALVSGSFLAIVLGVVSVALLQRLAPATYLSALLAVGARSVGYSEYFLQSIGWRLAGPFLNANSLGVFIVMAMPFMIAFAATASRQSAARRLVPLLLVASLVVLVFTLSRSSYAAFLVTLWYWSAVSLKNKQFRRITMSVLVVVLVGALYFAPLLYDRAISDTFAGGPVDLRAIRASFSVSARLDQWAAGLQAIGSYGLFGAGFGNVAEAVGRYLPPNSPSFGGIHQAFVRALLEGGIVSLVGLLYLLYSIWAMAGRLPASYRIAVRSSLLGLGITGLSGDTFQNVEIMVPFFYLLAALQTLMVANEPPSNSAGELKFETH